jgi:hypothetical protein
MSDTDQDPVLRAFRLAPTRCDEELTDEQRAAEQAAMAAGTAGSVPGVVVTEWIRRRARTELVSLFDARRRDLGDGSEKR